MKRWLGGLVVLVLMGCGKEVEALSGVEANDLPLPHALPGDWLDQHEEKGQTFEQFLASHPGKTSLIRNTIYLRPLGSFDQNQLKLISLTQSYLEAFFQTDVRLLDITSNAVIPDDKKRTGRDGNEQLLAGYILDPVLEKEKPWNAAALMAISSHDLYPSEDWNYVFGLASYSKQIGVSSIFRLQDGELTDYNFNRTLIRLLKVSSHEIGHMFGLAHCIDAACLMNGSNNLGETDRSPTRLCSHCQKKISHTLGYDHKKRLEALISFFENHQLEQEAVLLKQDKAAL